MRGMTPLRFLLLGLFVVAMTACGSDDDDAPVAPSPPTRAPTPTATAAPEPPAAPMIPATAPEPGSDEEQIMAVLEKQILAIHAADYVAFQETCTPSAKELPPIAQLRFIYEERQGNAGGASGIEVLFSPQGYNIRNVEVELLRSPFAKATFEVYDFDTYVSGRRSTKTFEKVDGQWYSESRPCDQA